MKRNLFIALEGIDGSGKSTQIKILNDKLTADGHKVYATFEPTDGIVGTVLRNIFKGDISADHRVIAGLFVADRLDHLLNESNGIMKKLAEGYTVITDRYYFSSYAYHSVYMDMEWVIKANAMSAQILRPDLNVFIDVSPEISMNRINLNRKSVELYESLENLKAVKDKYEEAFERLKHVEKIARIDGDRSVEEIAKDIWERIATLNSKQRK